VFAPGVPAAKSASVVSVSEERATAVLNVQVKSLPRGLPDAPVTVPFTVAVYTVFGARLAVGSSVAVPALYVTVARTSGPALARRVTVELVIVAGFIGSSNVTVTSAVTGTSVAFGTGVRPVTVGAVVSTSAAKTTSTQ